MPVLLLATRAHQNLLRRLNGPPMGFFAVDFILSAGIWSLS